MATKHKRRRSPGEALPKLTAQQRADVDRCLPVAAWVASFYARRGPPGLTQNQLRAAAEDAAIRAVCDHDASKGSLEADAWRRAHWAVKDLLRKSAAELGSSGAAETPHARMARAGREALDEFSAAIVDPGSPWDAREDSLQQYRDMADDAAMAWTTGGAGNAWHLRGEEGYVARAECVRGLKVLHDEVAGLPGPHATVVELRFFRRMKLKDVASAAGVSTPTVTRMIAEAIPWLRARLRARGIEDLSLLEGL